MKFLTLRIIAFAFVLVAGIVTEVNIIKDKHFGKDYAVGYGLYIALMVSLAGLFFLYPWDFWPQP